MLRPLRPARNLTDEIVDRIAAEVRSGRLSPGAQLPTEAELMSAMSVSRTVVREAIAALKAEGLVVTQQGRGAFVATDPSRVAFRIASDAEGGREPIAEVLRVMELRLAVEVEAAALAAERATSRQIVAIESASAAMAAAIAEGKLAVEQDFAFHRAIAEATANANFVQFLGFLGRHVIPRQVVRANGETREQRAAYLANIQREHEKIFSAIATADARGARAAMRGHLAKSIARYRRVADAAGE